MPLRTVRLALEYGVNVFDTSPQFRPLSFVFLLLLPLADFANPLIRSATIPPRLSLAIASALFARLTRAHRTRSRRSAASSPQMGSTIRPRRSSGA
jgi:hypothetical protein